MEKINSQMSTISPSYNYGPFPHLFEDEFSDFSSKPEGINAYFEFIKREGDWYSDLYGRIPTIVDFIRSTGREHIDPVLNFHIQNGADFIYNRDWKILGVLENSRPEDVFSSGYNILLNYGFTPLFFPNLENQFNSS